MRQRGASNYPQQLTGSVAGNGVNLVPQHNVRNQLELLPASTPQDLPYEPYAVEVLQYETQDLALDVEEPAYQTTLLFDREPFPLCVQSYD